MVIEHSIFADSTQLCSRNLLKCGMGGVPMAPPIRDLTKCREGVHLASEMNTWGTL